MKFRNKDAISENGSRSCAKQVSQYISVPYKSPSSYGLDYTVDLKIKVLKHQIRKTDAP